VNSDILDKEKDSMSFKGKDNWYWYNKENSVFNYTNIDRYKSDELKEIKSNLEEVLLVKAKMTNF
jgi:hypothetical protein